VTDERRTEEEAFFGGRGPPAPAPLPPAPARRRESPLLVRSPAFAVLALAACAWLLWDMAPDVGYFLSSREPIELGGPISFELSRARVNRLAHVQGRLVDEIPITEGRTHQARTVGRVAGTNLLVDRPGRGGIDAFEGRLLPARARGDYAEVAAVMRGRGAPLGEGWLVLRDGERPRRRWPPVLGSALLALLAAINLRALLRHLLR